MIDSCRDELLHHTFIPPPPPISSHHSHHCSNKGQHTHTHTHKICPACVAACVRTHPQAFCQKVQRPQLQTKKLLWMFIMYRVFPIYHRLYPSGQRSERDGLWTVHICRTQEEEAFSDVSARCTAFMGLHYNPFAPCVVFPLFLIASGVMQTVG